MLEKINCHIRKIVLKEKIVIVEENVTTIITIIIVINIVKIIISGKYVPQIVSWGYESRYL